jgi:hypothetical protein
MIWEMTMTTTYSVYEARAKFSEVMRKVRVIRLADAGAVELASSRSAPLRPLTRRPGALARFLKARA